MVVVWMEGQTKQQKKTAESFSELRVVVFDAVGDVGTIVGHRNWTSQSVESTINKGQFI